MSQIVEEENKDSVGVLKNENLDTDVESTETDKMLANEDTTKIEKQNSNNLKVDVKDELQQEAKTTPESDASAAITNKLNFSEEREVKPKKIPIGGLKLPGFFTKASTKTNKDSNEKNNDENDASANENNGTEGAENVLLDNDNKIKSAAATQKSNQNKKDNVNKVRSMGERFRDFVARKSTAAKKQAKILTDETKNNSNVEHADETIENVDEQQQQQQSQYKEQQQQIHKLNLLQIIGLGSKKKISNGSSSNGIADNGDIETGLSKAGLASIETLDDTGKDQDCVDKALSPTTAALIKNNKTTPKKLSSDCGSGDNDDNNIPDDKLKSAKLEIQNEDTVAGINRSRLTLWQNLREYSCSVDDVLIGLGVVLFFLLLAVVGYVLSHESLNTPPLRAGRYIDVVTGCGMVEGIKEDGAFAFRSIPYAQAPVGKKRWQPAQLLENIEDCWENKLYAHNGTEIKCLQLQTHGDNGTQLEGSEDCLYLDIVTPHVRYDNLLPVVVLIGADTFAGPSPGILRPSARYARSHDVVFVRPNFRMGALGFLALEALTKHAYPHTSGNYALTDIMAALQWIQLNIMHFGGNPKMVTLLGHRAGATIVTALVTSPLMQNLYARAWVSSPSSMYPGKPLAESEERNKGLMHELNCEDVACLLNATAADIWAATPDTWLHQSESLPVNDENPSGNQHEWLVLDGHILARHPAEIWKSQAAHMPESSQTPLKPKLVMGTTAHEMHSLKLRMLHSNWTASEVHDLITKSHLGQLNLTKAAIEHYNCSDYAQLVAMITDIRSICPLLINARIQPAVPFYVITQGDSAEKLAKVGADVLAILGRYEPHTVEERRFVSSIQQLFYYYVAHGLMPQYDPRRRVLKIEQDPIAIEDHEHCNFWIGHDIVPRFARL